MSRIGKQPVQIPAGVTITLEGQLITVKGSKGELKLNIHELMNVTVTDTEITVTRPDDSKEARSLHGLTRTLISNLVEGVTKGYERRLEIHGVGYRAKTSDTNIDLTLGFSHPVILNAPAGVKVSMDEKAKNEIIISGIDKQVVSQFAAVIRDLKKPEPYKGKGIRYKGEHIVRKAGKTSKK